MRNVFDLVGFRSFVNKVTEEYREELSLVRDWKALCEKLDIYRAGWSEHDKKTFRECPWILKRCYLFSTPVKENTKVIEGVIMPSYWYDTWGECQNVIFGSDGEEYYDTDTCISCKTKKEAKRIMEEMREN